jgi:succinylarginine dihydrolase
MNYCEVNFDGLVGPTHNYAGLSYGNVASKSNANKVANPKKAALQGLEKMHFLSQLGLQQGVLAPNARPDLATLRTLGFSGSNKGSGLALCKLCTVQVRTGFVRTRGQVLLCASFARFKT